MLNVVAYTLYPYISSDIFNAISCGTIVTAHGQPITTTTFQGEFALEFHNPGMIAPVSSKCVLCVDFIPGLDFAPGKTPHVTTTGDIEEGIKLIEAMSKPCCFGEEEYED